MHVVHRIVYYKRLYINFSFNILYVQMKGRELDFNTPTNDIKLEQFNWKY